MGFLKNFVGELAGKGRTYEGSVSFTVNGNPNDIRNFVKEKCTGEPHGRSSAVQNDKEKWLSQVAVKECNVKNDISNDMMFVYCQEWVINKMPCSISFQGSFAGANSTSLVIKYRDYCYDQKDVQKAVNIIKEAITDKFLQK